ncbi:hypothetical protein BGZ96_006789, partial [Linnemannia gamsii]
MAWIVCSRSVFRLSRPADLDKAIIQATVLYDILHQNEPTTNHTTSLKPEHMDID